MSLANQAFGGSLIGKTNAAADTVYYAVIPGFGVSIAGSFVGAQYTRIAGLNYTNGNTANSFTFMRPLSRTNAAAASNTAVNTITLTATLSVTGNNVAAGDQIVYLDTSGYWQRAQVSAYNATSLVLTATANLSGAVQIGSPVWFYGIPGDTDITTGSAFPVIPTLANTTAAVTFGTAGYVGYQKGDPLLVYNPNATNASNLNNCEYAYTLN